MYYCIVTALSHYGTYLNIRDPAELDVLGSFENRLAQVAQL